MQILQVLLAGVGRKILARIAYFLQDGFTGEEHNKILKQVLDYAEAHNLKLNYDKLQLWVPEIKYLGTTYQQRA